MELPMCTESKTLLLDPIRAKPNVDTEDPMRTKLRTEIELPRCRKSNTDTLDAHLPMPVTENADPQRA
jgi:hypothetical protein